MQKRSSKSVQVLAWTLIFCLLLGAFPAMAAEPRAAEETIPVSTTAQLVAAVEKLNGEVRGTIQLNGGDYILTEPLIVTSNITIQGNGEITAFGGNWTTTSPKLGGPYNGLIQVTSNHGRLSLCGDITVDPQFQCRAIIVSDGGELTLEGATIRNGRVTASEPGAGVSVGGSGSNIHATGGTMFLNNTGDPASGTSGGAIYVGQNATAELDAVTFQKNSAHSGGAIYTYHGLVKCTENTQFVDNSASQRGGAIHDHGTVVLSGTTIQGQKSDQYGGAVYVSANRTETSNDLGRLILGGATITGNYAGNSGGGVYIADLAQVLVSKSAKVTGNTASAENFASNLFAATADSKIITISALGCGKGELGVSTSNPYLHKVLVYSLLPEHIKTEQGTVAEDFWAQSGLPESYTMTAEDMSKFSYDSDLFILAKAAAPASPNDMWLKINPNNPGSSSSPKVIFDFNLPGNPAVVYPSAATLPSIDVGDALDLPTVQSEIKSGNITYTFLGWYSDATGGTRYTDTITVAEGTRVYYAQWMTKVASSGGTGVPGTAGLNLVYFDQNYEGGGLTTAYTFGGQFTFTVTFEGPDGAETSKDVDVYVPFEMPGDPSREGYLFTGWSENPADTSGVFQDSGWAPTNAVTTLYATWRAKPCDLTWDANGGSNGGSTTQDYGTTVLPPAQKPTREGHAFTGWYLDVNCTMSLTSGTPVRGDATFYAGWRVAEYTLRWDTNYTGGPIFSTGQDHGAALEPPADPTRDGYTFDGWFTAPASGTQVDASDTVTQEAVYYAHWTVRQHTLTWNANGGEGSGTTTQDHGDTVEPPADTPTREGHAFTGWYLDADCTTPLSSGTQITGDITFYAGWTPLEFTITWDTNYTGGSVVAKRQNYGEALELPTDPVRIGFAFAGWHTQVEGVDTPAESYGTVKGNVTFCAAWAQQTLDYTVTLEWDDLDDNDALRPEQVTVSLLRNDLPTGLSYTLTASDGDESGNVWSHTFQNLPTTDDASNAYVYSVAVTSPVSNAYHVGIENRSSVLGYILMTHTLVTRDVNAYVAWDDNGDQDGLRPSSLRVQLMANGQPVEDGEAVITLAGAEDAWTYTFEGVQKYYRDPSGQTGQEILYSISTEPVTGYTAICQDSTVTLRHQPEVTQATVCVVWADSNDQDGKRPSSMMVQLYADNVPLEGKYVLLSAANHWEYTWDELYRYADSGREVVYSAHVSSTLVDYTAASTGMTIEMTYTPSATTISAFVAWSDQENVDGLRPETLALELYADGRPTGDTQVVAETSGWRAAWSNYPIYQDGRQITYTIQVVEPPEGYEAQYLGSYDTSGLSVTLVHAPILAPVTVTIQWNDQEDIALARPNRVRVVLCADGTPLPNSVAVLDASVDWVYTFPDLPVYRNGGVPVCYSAALLSDVGSYTPVADGLTITMGYQVERVDVPLAILWDDQDNAEGKRPPYVVATLTQGGVPTQEQTMVTAATGWTATFPDRSLYLPQDPGRRIQYGVQIKVPEGYEAVYAGTTCALSLTNPSTISVSPVIHWDDQDNRYGQRPDKLVISLYADGVDTGRKVAVYAADSWIAQPFQGLPKYRGGKEIAYTISVTGNLGVYQVTETGMDAYLTHPAAVQELTRSMTATIIWRDGQNAKSSRPYALAITLYANGVLVETHSLTAADQAGPDHVWAHTFEALPSMENGAAVSYTLEAAPVAGYTSEISENTVTLTQVREIPVLTLWDDAGNNDRKRPDTIHLELYGDGTKTGRILSLTGSTTAKTWQNSFQNVPVWSETQTNKEVEYQWRLSDASASALTNGGYAVDYLGYQPSTISGEAVYPLRLSQTADVTTQAWTLTWADDGDRDGLRPTVVSAGLFADDGNGPVEIDRLVEFSGSTDAPTWSVTLDGLPVWKQGVQLHYTLQLTPPEGYTAQDMTLIHTPMMTDVTVQAVWEDVSNMPHGLTRADLTAELLTDGTPTGILIPLTAENGYKATPGPQYAYHDHGTAYTYSCQLQGGEVDDDYQVEVQGMTLQIRRVRYDLSGTVHDQWGIPAPGVTVTLYDSGHNALSSAVTDFQGNYNFRALSAGTYTLRALLAQENGRFTGSAAVSIENGSATGVDIILAQGGTGDYLYTVSGTLLDSGGQPVPNAQVEVWLDGALAGTASTGTDGRFSCPGLSSGIYELHVTDPQTGKSYAVPGGAAIENSDMDVGEIHLPNSADTSGEAQITTHQGVLDGVVVDPAGQPVSGAYVYVYTAAEPRKLVGFSVTDALGKYRFILNPGSYVVAIQQPYTTTVQIPVVVNGDSQQNGVSIISKTYTVSGTVVDEEGVPREGVTVYLYAATEDQSGTYTRLMETVTDAQGVYCFQSLPQGNYMVKISSDLGGNGGSVDYPITVGPDPSIPASSNIVVNPTAHTLSGVVTDSQGNPVAHGVVILLKDEKEIARQETGEDGVYRFDDLPSGTYTVRIHYPDTNILWNGSAQVEEGKTTSLGGQADPGGSSGGKPSSGTKPSGSIGNSGQPSGGDSQGVHSREVSAYMTGYVDGTFRPDGQLARCEAAAIFARISKGFDATNTYPTAFPDVPTGAWYENYLGFCVEKGIVAGWADGLFHPMEQITRAEFAAMAARFLGLTGSGEASSFPDVDEKHWASDYIALLARRNILAGDLSGNFQPERAIDRASAVKIINGLLSRRPSTEDQVQLNEEITGAWAAGRWFSDVRGHWAFYEIAEAALDHVHVETVKGE